MHKFEITNAEGGTAFLVQVSPENDANRIAGKDNDVLYIELDSVRKQEVINENLATFLSEKLNLSREKIAIASGHAIEKKIIIIMGLTPEEIESRLLA